MKKIQMCLVALVSGLLLTFISCDSENLSIPQDEELMGVQVELSTKGISAKNSGPSVNGQGTLTLGDETSRHFSFHANTMPDGRIAGNGVLTYTAGQRKVMFVIDCMAIDGSTAILSGTIAKDKQHPENVGNGIWFKVVDNGEGEDSIPDQMTLMFVGETNDCNFDYHPLYIALNDIEGGNIQVK